MKTDLDLSLIVAMTPEYVIGKDGRLPWRMPSDLARFRRITMQAGLLVMGRVTHQSIVGKHCGPLPGRRHLVLSRKNNVDACPGVLGIRSLEDACGVISVLGGRACVIGGAQIYRLFLEANLVRRVYVTTVYAPPGFAGDTHFPANLLPFGVESGWRHLTEESSMLHLFDPKDQFCSQFDAYERQ